MDTDTIRYKDKNREKQRQKILKEKKETPLQKKNFTRNKSWSKQRDRKDRKKRRSEKRKHDEVLNFLLTFLWFILTTVKPRDRFDFYVLSVFHLQGSDVDDDDIQELLSDMRLLKKLKKGRITEEDFEKQIAKSKHKTPTTAGSDEERV